jgi:hypothetical protein
MEGRVRVLDAWGLGLRVEGEGFGVKGRVRVLVACSRRRTDETKEGEQGFRVEGLGLRV